MGSFPETYNDPHHRHCSPLKGKAKSLDVFSSFVFFCAGLDKLTQGHGLLQVCFIFIFRPLKRPELHKATIRVARLNSLKYNGKSTSSVNLKSRFLSSLSCVVG